MSSYRNDIQSLLCASVMPSDDLRPGMIFWSLDLPRLFDMDLEGIAAIARHNQSWLSACSKCMRHCREGHKSLVDGLGLLIA
jgi:hypothetical protein